jgi:hypothetical protein
MVEASSAFAEARRAGVEGAATVRLSNDSAAFDMPSKSMTCLSAGRSSAMPVTGLVALGMLEVKAGSATTVSRVDGRTALAHTIAERSMDEAALEDLVEFRLLIEGQAAQWAAEGERPRTSTGSATA